MQTPIGPMPRWVVWLSSIWVTGWSAVPAAAALWPVFTRKTLPEWFADGGWQFMADLVAGWAPIAVGLTNMILLIVTLAILNRTAQQPGHGHGVATISAALQDPQSSSNASYEPPPDVLVAAYGGNDAAIEVKNSGGHGKLRVKARIKKIEPNQSVKSRALYDVTSFEIKHGEERTVTLATINEGYSIAFQLYGHTGIFDGWTLRSDLAITLEVIVYHVFEDVNALVTATYELKANRNAREITVTAVAE